MALPWNNGDRQPSTRMLGGRVEGCKLSHDFALAFFGVTGGAGACRGWVMMHFSRQQGS